ncbi:MAG: NAD(P)/FAD-dependent oxidoreductase [Promethearchaeota archaeon]
MEKYDVIIIGAGPAGMAAAIYASRGGLKTLVLDESAPAGGIVKTTSMVANYPGFVEPIDGQTLAENMFKQAKKYGAKFELAAEITSVDFNDGTKKVVVEDDEVYETENIIIATGRRARSLGLPGEAELLGQGISHCATCDGDFYKGKDIIVIGGGNSAMEESLLLLKYVKSITVIHQFDTLQAEKVTADKVLSHDNVKVLWSHEPRAFRKNGENVVVTVENLKTKERFDIEKAGVFIFVGMTPNSEWLKGSPIKLNKYGYIEADEKMQTNIKGVYAAGDIRSKWHWQITTAVSDGTIAALEVIQRCS